jgi:ATP-dependent Lhr-like helicase
MDALVEALEQLQGVAIPASVLERDVLPARVDGYRPALLDELCAAGELVWIGAGALGADDGRVRLYFRDRVRLLATRPNIDEAPDEPIHDAIRDRLLRAGASFWPDLVTAAGTADEAVLLTALWDLVWAGEVTNDTFGPLRVPRRATRARKPAGARPRPGRLTRLGPPAGAGRWSLVVPLLEPQPTPTEAAHAQALQLLERHGVVTREGVRAEGAAGGFAGVYPVLKALEESGKARRGWFVAGLGAAQFALPGAVDRLRAHRTIDEEDHARVLVLAATDPAQPYGAALPWPKRDGEARRPSRVAGAYVVLAGAEPVVYVERGGRGLTTLVAPDDPRLHPALAALAAFITGGRGRKLSLERIDGEPVVGSALEPLLVELGFRSGPRKLTLSA